MQWLREGQSRILDVPKEKLGAQLVRVVRPKPARANLQFHRHIWDWLNVNRVELCLL
jgi:hypothetical protein